MSHKNITATKSVENEMKALKDMPKFALVPSVQPGLKSNVNQNLHMKHKHSKKRKKTLRCVKCKKLFANVSQRHLQICGASKFIPINSVDEPEIIKTPPVMNIQTCMLCFVISNLCIYDVFTLIN